MGCGKIENDNIIKIGVVFLVYLFVMITAFLLFSTPVDMLIDAFDGIDAGSELATGRLAQEVAIIRDVVTIFWSLFVAVPVTWLIMKVFSREPLWRYQRRY